MNNGWSMRFNKIFFLFLMLVQNAQVGAQGTLEDYRRAEGLDSLFKVYKYPKAFYWLKSGDKFWYLNPTRDGKEFIIADVKKRTQRPAFNHARLAEVLSQKLNTNVDQKALPFDKIDFSDDLKSVVFNIDSVNCKCVLVSFPEVRPFES